MFATLPLSAAAQQAITPAPPDPAIAAALQQVSTAHIYSDIAKLVTFGNRSTLSSRIPICPRAPACWPHPTGSSPSSTRISAACGNCLEVKRDDFIEPPQTGPTARIVKPTRIVNIYAVLRGSDPAQAARRVLVTGHYDSRNTDVMNSHDPAPGANDDASGVAVSLECARVLTQSGIKFPASLVFVAVAGEEQGLNGSAHLAKLAKSEGWDLEAVLNNDIVGGDTTPARLGRTIRRPRLLRGRSRRGHARPAPSDPDRRRGKRLALARTRPRRGRRLHHLLQALRAARADRHTLEPRTATWCRLVPAFHPVLIFRRDRFLPRRRPHQLQPRRLPRRPLYRVARKLRPPAPERPRRGPGIQYGDLIQFVDPEYVANVARLNAATLAVLALAPGPPRNVRVHTEALDNNTLLTWDAPAGFPAGAGYEVVWRSTDAAIWTEFQAVPAHPQARPYPSRCPSPRTTSSSASARWTPPDTAAWPSIPQPPAPRRSRNPRLRDRPGL